MRIWMSPEAIRVVLQGLATPERAEPCGALLGYRVPLGIEVVEAVRLRNVHPSPDRAFLLEPAAILEAGRTAHAKELDVVGFWETIEVAGECLPSCGLLMGTGCGAVCTDREPLPAYDCDVCCRVE